MIKKLSIILFILLAYSGCFAKFMMVQNPPLWKSLPIKSQWEYENSATGGEGWQFWLSASRSISNPDIMYGLMDMGGLVKTTNAGERWYFCRMRGLHQRTGYSVQCDPVNPDIVFISTCKLWNTWDTCADGLWRSKDGGITWSLVYNAPECMNYQWPGGIRCNQNAICYDPTSVDADGAKVWYWAIGKGSRVDYLDDEYYSSSSGATDDHTVVEALAGTDYWQQDTTETHWFILDMGEYRIVDSVRGCSYTDNDPTYVNIYVSMGGVTWGDSPFKKYPLIEALLTPLLKSANKVSLG